MIVKVFSTQMGEKSVETQATTWEGLQSDLRKEGISYDKMKAVIGENKLTLEAGQAMLPATGFTLFLMNKKTKAGMGKKHYASHSYGELRGSIRFILDKDPSAATKFNEGKNYTTKGTEVLRDLLSKYKGITPSIKDVKEFLAEAKAKKGLKKPKKTKVIKNTVETPKRGFAVDKAEKLLCKEEAVKKVNPVIAKAEKAVEEVKEEKTVADVVESVKEDKEQEAFSQIHKGLSTLNEAISKLLEVDVRDLDHMLHEDIQVLRDRLVKKANDGNEIWVDVILAKKREAEAEAKKVAEAKAIAEARAEERRLDEEERLAQEIADEEIRVAEEKEAEEEAQKKAEYQKSVNDMRGMFSDVK
jgi:hypothetical protein